MIIQNVMIIEWRHVMGDIFNEAGGLSIDKELEIFERV